MIIGRDVLCTVDIYRIAIIKSRVIFLVTNILLGKGYRFMSFGEVDIVCESVAFFLYEVLIGRRLLYHRVK